MTTDHHTAYIDGTTTFEDSDMNAPLSELDSVFGGSFSGKKGQVARIANAESALEYFEFTYDVWDSFTGVPTSDLVIMRFPFVRFVSFPSGMSLSRMMAAVAATAETVFSLQIGGLEFGTVTFAAGAKSGTFSCPVERQFSPGNVLTVVAPNSPDATLADLGWCFAGIRNDYTMTTTSTTSTTSSTTTTS